MRGAKAELEREAAEESKQAPDSKQQWNFTDPDSAIMLNGEKAFVQAYNCQIAVDDTEHHIVVAESVSNQAADNPHLLPILVETAFNTGQVPDQISADAGYGSEANVITMDMLGIDAYLAQTKDKHTSARQPAPRGRIPNKAGPRERMGRKVRTKKGRKVYCRRKHVVEPVIGIIKQALGFRQFLLGGCDKVSGEWTLVTTAYNLRRLHDSGRLRPAFA